MSGNRSKKVRRELRMMIEQQTATAWATMLSLPFKLRIQLAWKLAKGKSR